MNFRKLIVPAVISAGLVAAASIGVTQAVAHHAFAAEFDGKSPVLLRGKVVKVEWMVEGGTPNTLLRAGIDRNSLKVGTEIVVRGYQSKDKACTPICKANGRDVTFPDGRKLFMGSSGTGAPKDGADKSEMP